MTQIAIILGTWGSWLIWLANFLPFFFNFSFACFFNWLIFRCQFFARFFFIFVACPFLFWLLFLIFFVRQFLPVFFLLLGQLFFLAIWPFFGEFFPVRYDTEGFPPDFWIYLYSPVFCQFFFYLSMPVFFQPFFWLFKFVTFWPFFFSFFGLPVFFSGEILLASFWPVSFFFLANFPRSLYNLLHRKIKTNYLPFTTTSKKRYFKL